MRIKNELSLNLEVCSCDFFIESNERDLLTMCSLELKLGAQCSKIESNEQQMCSAYYEFLTDLLRAYSKVRRYENSDVESKERLKNQLSISAR